MEEKKDHHTARIEPKTLYKSSISACALQFYLSLCQVKAPLNSYQALHANACLENYSWSRELVFPPAFGHLGIQGPEAEEDDDDERDEADREEDDQRVPGAIL